MTGIIVIRGLYDRHSRDMWWFNHSVEDIIEPSLPHNWESGNEPNIWERQALLPADQMLRRCHVPLSPDIARLIEEKL